MTLVAVLAAGLVTLAVAVLAVAAMSPAASAVEVTASSTPRVARSPGVRPEAVLTGCPFVGLHGGDAYRCPQGREEFHRLALGQMRCDEGARRRGDTRRRHRPPVASPRRPR
jgi:hypothetical protein